jgi:hypothetical protein
MTVTLTCKCGFITERALAPTIRDHDDAVIVGEVLADRHEMQNVRNAYRHDVRVEVTT